MNFSRIYIMFFSRCSIFLPAINEGDSHYVIILNSYGKIHVEEGSMTCPNCKHVYPIMNGIPNMVITAFILPGKAVCSSDLPHVASCRTRNQLKVCWIGRGTRSAELKIIMTVRTSSSGYCSLTTKTPSYSTSGDGPLTLTR